MSETVREIVAAWHGADAAYAMEVFCPLSLETARLESVTLEEFERAVPWASERLDAAVVKLEDGVAVGAFVGEGSDRGRAIVQPSMLMLDGLILVDGEPRNCVYSFAVGG